MTFKIDIDPAIVFASYKARNDYRMKQDPSPAKLQLKAILDKWVACTISVDDAEMALRELFATPLNAVDVECGGLDIKNPTGLPHHGTYKLNGHDMLPFEKLTLTIEAGCRSRLTVNSSLVNWPPKEAGK